MAGMRYLLDTNILSEPVAARPNPFVMEKIKANGTSLALASVTWQELLYGMYLLPAGKRRDRIQDYVFRRILPASDHRFRQECSTMASRAACPPTPNRQAPFLSGLANRSHRCGKQFSAGHTQHRRFCRFRRALHAELV